MNRNGTNEKMFLHSANRNVVPKRGLELRFNTVGSKYLCPICDKWFRPAMMAVWPMLAGTWSPVCEQCAAEQGFTLTLSGSSLTPAEELAQTKRRQPVDEKLFQKMAKWKCEHTGCDRPATQVIEWRHQDGDRERRILCQEYAVEDQKYWSATDWHTCVEVSDIEEWELSVSNGGRTVTRVGNLFCQSARP
jgi:hypothetical protein